MGTHLREKKALYLAEIRDPCNNVIFGDTADVMRCVRQHLSCRPWRAKIERNSMMTGQSCKMPIHVFEFEKCGICHMLLEILPVTDSGNVREEPDADVRAHSEIPRNQKRFAQSRING